MNAAEVAITITAADKLFEYDGNVHSENKVTVTAGQLLAGDTLVAEAIGNVTNVADTADGNNKIAEGYKIMHGEIDVTANYVITPVAGKLTVSPKAVTVRAKSEEFTYDGKAHSNSNYDVAGLVGSDAISAVVEGSITFPSESPVANELASYEFTSGTAGNYNVTTEDGELTMNAAEVAITITAGSGSKMYDGSALTNNEVTVTSGTLLEGDELVAEAAGSATNVADTAEGNNRIAEDYKVMHGEMDVTANYVITPIAGKLTITPRNITLTSADGEKVYDGTPLTKNEQTDVTVSGDGFVSGEGATYDITGTITDPGNTPNAFTYTLNKGTLADNYTIKTAAGTLIVKSVPSEIVITAASDSKKYDGSPLTNADYTYTDGILAKGDVLTATVEGTITDVGTAENVVTGYKVMRGETDVTANYTFGDSVKGKLEVTKRSVTLTSASDSKVYDGKPLTNDAISEGGDGFAEGEGATYNVTGSQTLVDSSKNTFTYTLNEGTKANNYNITKVEGTLTVTDGSNPPDTPVDPELVVTKKDAADGRVTPVYKLGDEVTFAITATNIYAEAQTITLSEIEGVTLAQSTFENVAPGATIKTTATYTITEADIKAGKFVNTVTAKLGNITKTAEATVETEAANTSMQVTKETTSTPAKDGKYALDETITYKITALNNGNQTIENFFIVDKLTGDKKFVESLAPGKTEELAVEYIVREEDILRGYVRNEATLYPTDPKDPDTPLIPDTPDDPPAIPHDPPVIDVPTEDPAPALSIDKEVTSTPALEDGYALNETVKYKITVKNTGNLTMTGVEVKDDLTGETWTIDSLAPGKEEVYEPTYIITAEDVEAGSVVNVATVSGKGPTEKLDPPPTDDTVTVPTTEETPDRTITVVYYTNYPVDGMQNQYRTYLNVPLPFTWPGFNAVFGAGAVPEGFQFVRWNLHTPGQSASSSGSMASEGGVRGLAMMSGSSDATIPDEEKDADFVFYAQWEKRINPNPGGTGYKPTGDDPEPDDDPEPGDEPEPTPPPTPDEEPEEDEEINEPDDPFAGY